MEQYTKISNEQKIAMEYVRSSHLQIPMSHSDLKSMNIPFVLAVTPFQQTDSPFKPPTLKYDLNSIPLCTNCHSFLNTLYSKNEDSKLICPVCHQKNKIPLNFDFLMMNSNETKSSVYDTYFPEAKQDSASKEQNDPINPPSMECQTYLLSIERSEATINNGLFQNTIEKIRETFSQKTTGVITIFVYDSYLHVPFIPYNNRNKSFSIMSICDLSDDKTVLPPAKSLFFDLETEKSLFNQYLDFLISSLSNFTSNPTLPLVKVFDLVRILNIFCQKLKIPSVIVTSQNPIGTSEEFRNFGLEILRRTSPFKFFCVTPPSSNPPDFTPLSEFSFIVNSKCQVFSQCQINYLPIDIINELQVPVFSEIIVYMSLPDYFQIVDIKGPGLRRSEKAFILPYMSPNDSVYVYLDYKVSKLKPITHSIQAQVRYLDSHRKRYVRVTSLCFYCVNNNASVAHHVNYDVYLASLFTSCIDKAREFSDTNKAVEEIKRIRKDFHENQFSKLYFLSQPGIVAPKINCAFSVAEYFLSDQMNYPLIFGRSPVDVSRFFVPIGYSILHIDSNLFQGPMTLCNLQFSFSALYVKMNNRRALLIINDQYAREAGQEEFNNFVNTWTDSISKQPLSDVINNICHGEENVIEIIIPSLSADHNLYKHVLTCIRTRI